MLSDGEPGATILGMPGTQDIDVVDAVHPRTIASITVIAFIPAFAAPGPSRWIGSCVVVAARASPASVTAL